MSGDILALDVGTSALKMGVFGPDLEKRCEAHRAYDIHLYDHGKADVDPQTWWSAIRDACAEIRDHLGDVEVVTLSVTTPGLTPMAADGAALGPAILFLDGRSRAQAAEIRRIVGDDRFLARTCNLPVSGGSSLASILWIRDQQPDVWSRARMFGHCNTYLTHRMTGEWAVDPSTVSITGMYDTVGNTLTWDHEILELAGIDEHRLPCLMQSYDTVGVMLPEVADELGLPHGCSVLCGGNDATLAAFSGGLTEPGDANLISGTCDIANVCIDRPVASPHFNIRAHVIPGRWLTFFVLNTGGAALDWFREVTCRELEPDRFFDAYLPRVLDDFLADPDIEERERTLPDYTPYLGGSRYSLEPLTGAWQGLTLQTSREDLLVSVVRGNARYLGDHLAEVARLIPLRHQVGVSGGGFRTSEMVRARRRWTGDFDYRYQEQSSLLGAALLGRIHQTGFIKEAIHVSAVA